MNFSIKTELKNHFHKIWSKKIKICRKEEKNMRKSKRLLRNEMKQKYL